MCSPKGCLILQDLPSRLFRTRPDISSPRNGIRYVEMHTILCMFEPSMKGIILVSGRISAISVRINVRIISAYEIGVFLIVV